MNSRISRRSFLELLVLLPLFMTRWNSTAERASDSPPSQKTPNILILLFDTLSARHMPLYGYIRETTPNLARFAERATVYHSHYAGGNFTTPGTASLLTGAYPWAHRAINSAGTVAESYRNKNLFGLLDDSRYAKMTYSHNPLAAMLLYQFRESIDVYLSPRELALWSIDLSDRVFPHDSNISQLGEWAIRRSGIRKPTSLFMSVLADARRRFVGGDEIWGTRSQSRLSREYENLFPKGLPNFRGMFFTLEDAIDGITTLIGSHQPFLGYFHLMPPHSPYCPRREFIGIFDDDWTPLSKRPHIFSEGMSDETLSQLRREYDEYTAYADAEFGRLYDSLEKNNFLDNTYIVVTSDHGELFERGVFGHTTPLLYEPVIHIPLLISGPGQQQREDVYVPTSCVDLLPTLLHITDHVVPNWCEGKVLPPFANEEITSERSVFSVEAKRSSKFGPLNTGTVALIKDQHKLIHYFGYASYDNVYELYDLKNDPEEMENLYSSKRLIAANLQSELENKLQEMNRPYLS